MDGITTSAQPELNRKAPEGNGVPSKKPMKQKECAVCCVDVAINKFPKSPYKGAEKHNRDVCFKCWEQYLAAEVENQVYNDICCASCKDKLEEPTIRRLASKVVYQK